MKKKTLALVLAVLMLVSLTACSASSSTTSSFSTTVNGETTTTTTTTTVGTDGYSKETVTTTESENEPEYDRNADWYNTFFEGAEGQGEDGSLYYFAVDDFSDMNEAAFLMISAGEAPDIYIMGHFQDSDDGLLLVDDYKDSSIHFWVTDTEVEDGFELEFDDGERIAFFYVDQDTIIDDMLAYVH